MPRPRLSAGPDDGSAVRLALVAAPAGSGKTTLLSEWHLALRERGECVAWLSIDEFDNDPRRFLSHLISAIHGARPDLGNDALRILSANAEPPLEDLAESLVHDLGTAGSRITVFLDDYHMIRDRAIHAVMEYLIRYVPSGIRFVIGSRRVPPLSIERMRMRGELQEIGWEQLRFNVEEARGYLNGSCCLGLSEEHIHSLCNRTEGWITGLQLAAINFTGTDDADGFVGTITGEQRKISGYLMEGVFRRQGTSVRQFLMKTSILDRMSAPLCDALTGRHDGRQMVEALESRNLFIFGLDDRRCWYRYHQLFSEFLQDRLRTELPEEVDGLHDRASEWYERNHLPTEAVRYAIAGNRYERAARLLEGAGRELFRHGDFKELRRWLDAMPDDVVRKSALLCTLHAWALEYQGEFDAARQRIASAEAVLDGAGRSKGANLPRTVSAARAELGVVRAVLGIIQTDEPDVSGLDPDLASCFPPEESALRGYAAIAQGFACRMAGDLPDALQHFREALETSDAADNCLVSLNARLNIGVANDLMGRTREAERSFRESLDVASRRLWHRSIGSAFLRYGLAVTLHEQNRLDEALHELSDAITILEAASAFGFLGVALVERARTHAALGRLDLCGSDVAYARQVAREHRVDRVTFRADLLESALSIRMGEIGKASAFLESARDGFRDVRSPGRCRFSEKHEIWLIEQLRLLIALKRFEEAARLSASAVRSAKTAGRGRHVIEFLIFLALASDGLLRKDKALASIREAMALAEEEGVVRPFVTAGGRILPLLRHFENDRRWRAVAKSLLSALQDRGIFVFGKQSLERTDESFHHREIQILDLISKGLRNREIGQRLFLSEETVKWYLKRLYCKLYVGTRTEAIAKARKLSLIS